MTKSCQVAQDLMQEIVQSVTDHDVQLKTVLTKLEAAAGDATIKEEVVKANKRLDATAVGHGLLIGLRVGRHIGEHRRRVRLRHHLHHTQLTGP